MKTLRRALLLSVVLSSLAGAAPASPQDEVAIRKIVADEVAAWNAGDAKAFSASFASDGSMTNIVGTVVYGHQGFESIHARIFSTFFKGSRLKMTVARLRFVTPEVAVVDADTEVSKLAGPPPGVPLPPDGILRTRLQQVFVKRKGAWWIEAYHNVAVASGTPSGAASSGAPR